MKKENYRPGTFNEIESKPEINNGVKVKNSPANLNFEAQTTKSQIREVIQKYADDGNDIIGPFTETVVKAINLQNDNIELIKENDSLIQENEMLKRKHKQLNLSVIGLIKKLESSNSKDKFIVKLKEIDLSEKSVKAKKIFEKGLKSRYEMIIERNNIFAKIEEYKLKYPHEERYIMQNLLIANNETDEIDKLDVLKKLWEDLLVKAENYENILKKKDEMIDKEKKNSLFGKIKNLF